MNGADTPVPFKSDFAIQDSFGIGTTKSITLDHDANKFYYFQCLPISAYAVTVKVNGTTINNNQLSLIHSKADSYGWGLYAYRCTYALKKGDVLTYTVATNVGGGVCV